MRLPLVLGHPARGPRTRTPHPLHLPCALVRRPRAGARATPTREEGEMPKKLTTTLAAVIVLSLVACPAAVAAAGDLNQVIDNIRVWVTGLLAALATLLLMIGGVRYLLAG